MGKGLRLSKKHGVNPSISVCFFCGKHKNELLLLGKLKGDVQAPKEAVYNHEPCGECADLMKKGIMVIEVDPELTEDIKNPYRTGSVAVMSDAFFQRTKPQGYEEILKKRMCFMEREVWDAFGIPR